MAWMALREKCWWWRCGWMAITYLGGVHKAARLIFALGSILSCSQTPIYMAINASTYTDCNWAKRRRETIDKKISITSGDSSGCENEGKLPLYLPARVWCPYDAAVSSTWLSSRLRCRCLDTLHCRDQWGSDSSRGWAPRWFGSAHRVSRTEWDVATSQPVTCVSEGESYLKFQNLSITVQQLKR